jgi:hypothetical protein
MMHQAPYKDSFHAVDLIVKFLGTAEAKAVIGRRLGAIIRKPAEEDVKKVVQHLMTRKGKPHKAEETAREHAISHHKTEIRTVGRQANTIAAELQTESQMWEKERAAWERRSPPRGPVPYYRKESYDGLHKSTADLMGNLCKCAVKGCLSDCRPWKDLYIDVRTGPQTGLTSRIKKSESVKNEAWHRIANLLVARVSFN